MLVNIVKSFEGPLVSKALYKCSPFTGRFLSASDHPDRGGQRGRPEDGLLRPPPLLRPIGHPVPQAEEGHRGGVA